MIIPVSVSYLKITIYDHNDHNLRTYDMSPGFKSFASSGICLIPLLLIQLITSGTCTINQSNHECRKVMETGASHLKLSCIRESSRGGDSPI